MKFEMWMDFTSWLIGINVNWGQTQEVIGPYVYFHFLCFHMGWFKDNPVYSKK